MGKVIKMKRFESATYSINDFLEWHERKQLILSPKFQRRSVWKDVAKSFLMDSILRDKPLPKLFIRQITDIKNRTTTREVVDGQQRLRTIIDFVNDGFKIKKVHNSEHGEKYFSQLDEAAQSQILTYKFAVDILLGVEDSEIMDVFARLNTYTTRLNTQELINSEFYGYFKQLVYGVSHRYNKFWVDNKIFTEYQTMRMQEVELTADIFVAFIDGIQSRKIVRNYYKKYDDSFDDMRELEKRFDFIITLIEQIFDGKLKESNFRKPALFYSLSLALFNLKYDIANVDNMKHIEGPISEKVLSKIKTCLDKIEETIKSDDLTKEQSKFVAHISRATSDTESRKIRTQFIINEFNKAVNE